MALYVGHGLHGIKHRTAVNYKWEGNFGVFIPLKIKDAKIIVKVNNLILTVWSDTF